MSKTFLEKTNKCFVNESEIVTIGGVDQYILVRGNDKNNPIILFLHGGPGIPYSPNISEFQSKIEKNFIVANWDQRGAGKSYNENIPKDSMNLEQLASDTIEVVNYLLKKFNKNKLYLVGQSFASVFGLITINNYPEKFYAYIGIGQIVNSQEGEKISYEFLLDEAKKQNHILAIKELEKIGHPPYKNCLTDISIQRKWLNEFGYVERNSDIYEDLIKNCTDKEFKTIMDGSEFSVKYLFTDLIEKNINFFNSIKEVKAPVYFCMGRYDYTTPSIIVEKYARQLKAPKKESIWFENSAHFPEYEETDKFYEILLRILEETYN
ncbi:alpha/beta fold hydrolase [Abyssisolibacter fermentans]|uniref:alpha/beta fold hydrolase n=1 Tax=Abyssisolibacter fermentans TaxID=1766203 RepID=UPI000B327289|nr:alpha/beta hydrolase [Abyssisolibacter fermentans]